MIFIEKKEEGGNIYYDNKKKSLSLDNERDKLNAESAKRTEEIKQKKLDTLSKKEDIMRKRRDEAEKKIDKQKENVKQEQKDFQDRVGDIFFVREPYGFFGKYVYNSATDKYHKINSSTSVTDSSLLFNREDVSNYMR